MAGSYRTRRVEGLSQRVRRAAAGAGKDIIHGVSKALTIGFLGGTGVEGRGLALRFAKAGVPVLIGSRSLKRARQVAEELNRQLGVGPIGAAENPEMIGASELIFLTVPFQQARAALDAYRESFRQGSVLVDATVPLTFGDGPIQIVRLEEGSGSQSLAKLLPEGIPLVATFKTIPAHVLADLQVPLDCDAFVCSDSEQAKARVMEAIRLIPGLRPVDAGSLEAASTLERMSILAIEINRRYKIKAARFRIVGL